MKGHANIEDIYPLSPMQEGMLFHSLFAPEEPTYFRQVSCRLMGALDQAAFERVWQKVIDHHSSLRTGFVTEGVDEPVQVVYRRVELPIERLDWRDLTAPEQDERFATLLEEDRRRGFDLAVPPLMRLRLIETGPHSYRFVWSYHHLLLDGWSLALLLEEVFASYRSLAQGVEPPPVRRRPYRDYIAWLRQRDLQASEEFWRSTLQGFTMPTSLTGDPAASAPRRPASGCAEERLELDAETTERLQALARDHKLTLGTLLQGAWGLLLSRYTGEEDVVFGMIVAGRPTELSGFERMIGLFINTLPVRLRVSPQSPLLDWLKGLQEAQAEARQHEHCPLAKVQGWSDVARGVPLFESLLAVQNQPVGRSMGEGEPGELRVLDVRHPDASNYPLTLIGTPGARLELRLLYDLSRFTAGEARSRLVHFTNLLGGMLEGGSQRLGELPLLTPAERETIARWNDRQTAFPRERCIHELFDEVAAAIPGEVAVVFGTAQMSYGELRRQADLLAGYLRSLGIGPDARIGLCAERSLEMIVGLLAILKAGAAYVPLNPADPLDRLMLLVEQAGISVVVARSEQVGHFPMFGGPFLVLLDEIPDTPGVEAAVHASSPENLAYVVFTSGSTGQPKGVSVSHRAVLRLVRGNDYASMQRGEVFLQLAPVAFDASTFEIWGCLLNGGRLVLMSPGTPSLEDLGNALTHHRVTTLFITTSLFNLMVDRRGEDLRGLRQLLFGGDVVSPARVAKVVATLPDCALIHCYGPTECTTFATCGRMSAAELAGPLSIGRPIANTQAFVVSRSLELLPVGVAGELCLGGEGLARGYLGAPELTAEKFIPSPFGSSGERLYRTGDLARWFADGRIEFLGRLDHQVKIRGFRVEPGEIEAVLGQHPAVRQAVVLAHQDESGEKRLVAYVVGAGDVPPPVDELRQYVAERLPPYMMPAAFIRTGDLPLTANGKVDRRKLAAPGALRSEPEESYVPPRTPEEKALAEIWAEVLKVGAVGVNDNFFSLGGDSIRSIDVLARAEQRGIKFSLQQLFDSPTIAGLLQEIRAAQADAGATASAASRMEPFALSPSQPQSFPPQVEDAFPLASMQAGMIFHSELQSGSPIYVEMVSYHLRAPLDVEAMRTAMDRLGQRHPIVRTAIDLAGHERPLQLVHASVKVPLEVLDLRHLGPEAQEAHLDRWLKVDSTMPFDYSQPPLLRFHIHWRSDETFQFTLAFHHAILDGWSVGVLLTDLFQLYLEILGRTEAPPPPSLTYRDFVALELAALASEEHERFWAAKMEQAETTLLPRRPFPGGVPDHSSEEVQVLVRGELLGGLNRLAAETGVPLKSVILAAHLRVLSLITGQASVTTGYVTNGRPEQGDGERIVGLFLNTLPLPVGLPGGTWHDLVRQTFAAEREIWPYRRYPFAELQRRRGGRPLFEANFNFVHFHIYDGMKHTGEVEVLSGASYAETNFPFAANVQLDQANKFMTISLIYHAGILPAAQVEEIAGYYRQVLSAMVGDPLSRYELTPLLSGEESRLLKLWNQTAVSYPPDFSNDLRLDELVVRQAARTPDRVAVVSGERTLTYRDLEAYSGRLARYLRDLGAGVETPVGIYLERSFEMVVAVLGVLRAGATYVPLDPSLPRRRLEYMLRDLDVPFVVTVEALRSLLPGDGPQVVSLDRDAALIAAAAAEPPASGATAPHLAYVIYTSGSTGWPKAVMVPHRAIGNRLLWQQHAFPLDGSDAVLFKTPMSFDASIWEIFLPLLAGARVVVARPGGHQDPSYLLQEIERRGVTVLQIVPSLLPSILADPASGNLAALRLLFCGGEALPADLVARATGFGLQVVNLYGPTETAIDTSFWTCGPGAAAGIVPIGRPLANLQIHLLDAHGQPVPVGTPGELHVGGASLARGYHGQPALSAARFVPDPFGAAPGERLYRTGDIARWRPDGVLEFQGRADQQVKVRGVRIEPAEIESLLRRHPAVREAVVLARRDRAGHLRLVGYVVPGGGDAAPAAFEAEVREYLRGYLSEAMMPAAFVVLSTLPATASGKLDRALLPDPDWEKRTVTAEFVPPRTPIEETLAEIWAEVLEVRQIGVHDSFFDLGGHSLLALPVIARIRKAFGVELPLARLFDEPTIEALSVTVAELLMEKIEELSEEEAGRLLQSIEPAGPPPTEKPGLGDRDGASTAV